MVKWLRDRKQELFRYFLLGLAIAFMGIGIWRGEAAVVLKKAINICMECIGIG